ncbi:hypothetical protein ACULNC_16200 [Shigella flexneri]
MLGLGDVGALAGKPVMEGKGVLLRNSLGLMYLTLKLMNSTRTNLLKSSPRSNRPSAASTSKP